ncbi:MAG: hypothetical protein FWD53_06465 [Phycisphaerales bacterium]|nr:hypothetical protein [Phycisphaerales bacterium]
MLTRTLLLSVAVAFASNMAQAQVCNVKVLSDKAPDVSSIEAWQKSFITPGMSNHDKGLAIWKSILMFQMQDAPPQEFLQHENAVYDPIKMFNVYGYAMCSPHSAHLSALARHLGFKARGWAIKNHSIAEMFYDDSWHHFDPSLGMYYLKEDGSVASIDEIIADVKAWYAANTNVTTINDPDRDKKLRAFERTENRQAWKIHGPKIVANFPHYDHRGWIPSGMIGWYGLMQAFDGTSGQPGTKAYFYEYCASMGYQVNIQLRPGEKITRNWSNTGKHINEGVARDPGSLKEDHEFLVKTQQFTDKIEPRWPYLANGRVGNGTHEYNVPLASAALKNSTLQFENLASRAQSPALHTVDAAKPGVLVFRMPSSYVYLGGTLTAKAVVGNGGSITAELSDNNGLDWKPLATFTSTGEQTIDLKPHIIRRYDYRLRFTLQGNGTGLDAINITQDIQHSQRPLPALAQGPNQINFSTGPQEGTITIEANNSLKHQGKQVVYTDFKPTLQGLNAGFAVEGREGTLTVPITVPGEMTRLRANACYRTWTDKDNWTIEVSFDDGKTFKQIGEGQKQFGGVNMYCTTEVPTGTKAALVRYKGTKIGGGNVLGSFRIDADYKSPTFAFAPVKITYNWQENGEAKQNIHLAKTAQDAYTITCETKPKMTSIVLELD